MEKTQYGSKEPDIEAVLLMLSGVGRYWQLALMPPLVIVMVGCALSWGLFGSMYVYMWLFGFFLHDLLIYF